MSTIQQEHDANDESSTSSSALLKNVVTRDSDTQTIQATQASTTSGTVTVTMPTGPDETRPTVEPPLPPTQQPIDLIRIVSNIQCEDGRYCWVCFATDEDDELATWVQPCRCSGTTKWVHQSCLQRWVDEKQKGNSFKRVNCPQCQTEYIIIFPEMGSFVGILEGVDTMIKRLSPFLAAGVIVGSLYWTAVSYGAVTVLQVLGHKSGLDILENSDPLVLLIGLPAIPVGLVLGRMIRWEEMVLRCIQNRHTTIREFPLLSLILPVPEENDSNLQVPNNIPVADPLSATRVFCGALLLPTVSAMVGRLFFDSIQNNLHRTLIGGLSFIIVKGALKIYFKHKQLARKKQRKILDFTDENVRRYSNKQQQPTPRPRNSHMPVGNENIFL